MGLTQKVAATAKDIEGKIQETSWAKGYWK